MNASPLLASLAEFFEIFLQTSVRGSLMAVGVLALQAAIGRRLSPRWRYGLWLAVLMALLLPPIPRPSIDIEPYRETPVLRYVFPAPAPAVHAEPLISAPSVPIASIKTGISMWEIAAVSWVAGAVIVAAFWLCAHHMLLRRFKRGAQPTSEEIIAQVRSCASVVGLHRHPRILQAAAITSPAVTGFGRGTLLLPADAGERFTAAELRFVLLHELSHLRRGDLLFNWVVTALLALHWFNPILWFVAVRLRADRESACDATVLGHCTSDERSDYGHTLLKLHTVAASHGNPAFVGILERSGSMRRRIQHIAAHGTERLTWGIGAAALTGVWLLCIGVQLNAQTVSPPQASAPEATLEKRLLQRLSNAQLVEIGVKMFQIDPSIAPTTVGSVTVPHESQRLNAFSAVLNSEDGKEFLEKLAQTEGVRLMMAPGVTTRSGQRATIESGEEFRYATEWSEPAGNAAPEPSAFETRNVGVSLEVEPIVTLRPRDAGKSVLDLNLVPQLVFFGGWEDAKTPGGSIIQKPKFIDNRKITTSVSVYDGQHVLVWQNLELPEGKLWEVNRDQRASEVKLRRRIILWVISPRIVHPGGLGQVPPAIASELFEPRDWDLVNAPVEQWVAYFTKLSRALDPQKRGLNLVLGKPTQEPPLVTLDLKGVSLIAALEHAFKAAGMRIEEQADYTLLITAEPPIAPVPR